jgi:UDPglucose 6-dehydrogenase
MNVSIVGSGYVGTTVAACLADAGHYVVNIDIDESTVVAINDGDSPIHEPGLDGLISEHGGDRLRATTDYDAVRETDLTMLALPTPSNDDGSIDTSIIEGGADALGDALAAKNEFHLVVVKSTVIPGTTEEVLEPAIADASGKTPGEDVTVAVNPEFQREGSAVADFQNPDKIVFGTADHGMRDRALETLEGLYSPVADAPIVRTGRREAEMIKYAS